MRLRMTEEAERRHEPHKITVSANQLADYLDTTLVLISVESDFDLEPSYVRNTSPRYATTTRRKRYRSYLPAGCPQGCKAYVSIYHKWYKLVSLQQSLTTAESWL